MYEELNKKLAEWVGLEVLWKRHYKTGEEGYEAHQNLDGVLVLVDDWDFTQSLDVCFKWPVPQALGILASEGYIPPIMKLFQLWYDELVSLTGDSNNVQQAALALCLAIEKLIDKETR